MVLFSKYDDGKFNGGVWYCGCNEEVKWHTPTKDGSRGERFARCKGWGAERDCKFFLTKADEARARLEQSCLELPPPASRRTSAMMSPGSGSRVNLFGGRGGRARASLTESPTARRFVDADRGDGDLAGFVIDLLQQEGIVFRSAAESRVRHVIGGRIAKYKAALNTSKESLGFALRRLDELEGGMAG